MQENRLLDNCGGTGYKWSPREPFVAIIFEKKLQLEKIQREFEKAETLEERIARITKKIETSPDIQEERKHWEQARRRGMLDSDTDSEREEAQTFRNYRKQHSPFKKHRKKGKKKSKRKFGIAG